MTGSLVLHGGEVLTQDGLTRTDVLVQGGEVRALGTDLVGDDSLDCTGAWIGPGFVDLHTHLREPGQEHKETIATGSAAAAAGGYTAVLAMPNTSPAIDTADRVEWVRARGAEAGLVEVAVAGAVTKGRQGEELADIEGMLAAGVRWFTDDGDTVRTSLLLREALVRLRPVGGVISEHAEDPALTQGAVMHAGETAELLGLAGMPAVAETIIIARDLLLAEELDATVHMQHVSTARSVELIAAARERGIRVTAEATPHHLTFDHTELKARDPRFKMKPPLRTGDDVEAVRAAVRAGVIDVVATDHAPHTVAETTDAGLEQGAFGVIGLETAAAATNTVLSLDPESFFDRLSIAPARLGGFATQGQRLQPGSAANLVVFDPAREWLPTEFRSRSQNSPFIGRPLRGRVLASLYRGEITHQLDAGPA